MAMSDGQRVEEALTDSVRRYPPRMALAFGAFLVRRKRVSTLAPGRRRPGAGAAFATYRGGTSVKVLRVLAATSASLRCCG